MKRRSLKIIHDEHASLAAMLQSARMMVDRGPTGDHRSFFETLRAMLFYIDEFPERLHHPKETRLLFPRVVQSVPGLSATVAQLNRDHDYTETAVRDLEHLLLAWELLGDVRKTAFIEGFTRYIERYLAHMQLEEREILPAAEKHLGEADWQILDAAFEQNRDPLTGSHKPAPEFAELFSRILREAPAPIGLGSR